MFKHDPIGSKAPVTKEYKYLVKNLANGLLFLRFSSILNVRTY